MSGQGEDDQQIDQAQDNQPDAGEDTEIYDAFDQWMGDAEAAGVELQNQAAALEDAEKEERTFRGQENIKDKATALGCQLVVRF